MNCHSWAYVQKSDDFQLSQQDEHYWSSEGKTSFTRWPPSWLTWGTVGTAGCSSTESDLESQFSSTYIFLYLSLLYSANYKKDKLIICKSRKYWDSYCKKTPQPYPMLFQIHHHLHLPHFLHHPDAFVSLSSYQTLNKIWNNILLSDTKLQVTIFVTSFF